MTILWAFSNASPTAPLNMICPHPSSTAKPDASLGSYRGDLGDGAIHVMRKDEHDAFQFLRAKLLTGSGEAAN
jgi:hypothetical protein